jgi:hypothetical protein
MRDVWMTKRRQKSDTPSKRGAVKKSTKGPEKTVRRRAPHSDSTVFRRKLTADEAGRFLSLLATHCLNQVQFCEKLIETKGHPLNPTNLRTAKRTLQFILTHGPQQRPLSTRYAKECAKTLGISHDQLAAELLGRKPAAITESDAGPEPPIIPYPFELIDNQPKFFRLPGQSVLIPSKEEYLARAVHEPPVSKQIVEQLKGRGWSMVRGRGASGKQIQFGILP